MECAQTSDFSADPAEDAAIQGIALALASVGRSFICLDGEFRIVHVSWLIDRLIGPGASSALVGESAAALLGEELFGAGGPLRLALLEGKRREGWRATLHFRNAPRRLVSITAARMLTPDGGVYDPRVRYIVLLRPAEEEELCPDAPIFCSGAVACSPAMQSIFRLVETLEQSEAAVLITGESGSGKEVVARAIHEHSQRSGGPFVAVNCGALPADLLESELFGHVRGAFTGAVRDRAGRFELASHGTLFLDEIGDLPAPLQVKLLRVLQERQYERVGESIPRTTQARIIAATNVDTRVALRQGRLREDLYYRLCVVPIEVPPLRERREDIAPLTATLLNRITAQRGLVRRISPQAMRLLLDHSWPGNVRELANAIEYAVAVSKMETILPEDLPRDVARSAAGAAVDAAEGHTETHPASHRSADMCSSESQRLRAALDAHHWRRGAAARSLGLSRSTLWRRMRELHMA